MRLMRILVFALLLGPTALLQVWAGVPETINVQGRLTDASGTPLPPGFKQFEFSIYTAEAGGILRWGAETQFLATDADGLWTASVGSVEPITVGVFSDSVRWLQITVDDGVGSVVTLPRVRLESGAYAYVSEQSAVSDYALTAKDATNAIYADTADVALSSAPDDDWVLTDSILFTSRRRGIVKGDAGNYHFGDSAQTMVNLGVSCTTGVAGNDIFGATIAGGRFNAARSDEATVSGGSHNQATNSWSTVGGGSGNVAGGSSSTTGGGYGNTASGAQSTVSGGTLNEALGDNSTIGGGRENLTSSPYSVVGGGKDNSAYGDSSVIGGGAGNLAFGSSASIGGGWYNFTTGDFSVIGGGSENRTPDIHSTVGGGLGNSAGGLYSTVGGGQANETHEDWCTIAGGQSNSTAAAYASVGGGVGNAALAERSTVGGGHFNTISSGADYSTIVGGQSGIISGTHSMIGGGRFNRNRGNYSVVCGGGGSAEADSNSASGDYASIGGGRRNYASGNYAIVPGGYNNNAKGAYSFAGGYRALAGTIGKFVWADASSANLFAGDLGDNSFNARTYGGAFFATGDGTFPNLYVGAKLNPGATAWSAVCDRNAKTNIRAVDGAEVLDKLAELPIARWNYKHQADNPIDHIGPMAQDFYRLFQVGHDEKTISTLDPDGVALAAIKELSARNSELEKRVEELTRLVEQLALAR